MTDEQTTELVRQLTRIADALERLHLNYGVIRESYPQEFSLEPGWRPWGNTS